MTFINYGMPSFAAVLCAHTLHTVLSHDRPKGTIMSTKLAKSAPTNRPGRKSSVVRRAFSMQEADARLIESLRVRCAKQGTLLNQSEVIRAGLRMLSAMSDAELGKSAASIERLTSQNRRKGAVEASVKGRSRTWQT